jgi:hypothetical protein
MFLSGKYFFKHKGLDYYIPAYLPGKTYFCVSLMAPVKKGRLLSQL